MAKTAAERKRESRANRIAQGFCGVCTARKAAPGKSTCQQCLDARLKEPKPIPALRRKITVDEAREILTAVQDSGHDDQAMAVRYAINKVLG